MGTELYVAVEHGLLVLYHIVCDCVVVQSRRIRTNHLAYGRLETRKARAAFNHGD
jgi:hypothetical protein